MSDIKTAVLDSVIFISDSVAIMVTSERCLNRYLISNAPINPNSVWWAGRQTVVNHPLFSKRHALDSIRRVIKKQYYFTNPADSIVFVGYDNNRPKDCDTNPGQYQAIPISINNDDDQTPFGPTFVLMFSSIVILSVIGGAVAWNKNTILKSTLK